MKLYIVGGAVRDLLLGKTPTDVDMSFDCTSKYVQEHMHEHMHKEMQEHICEEIQAQMEDIAHVVGKSVRVFLCGGCEYSPLKGDSITNDLHSRDLTINAMALPLGEQNGCFYAHPLALHDLAQGVLRPTSDTAFYDDPLRIYRMARFAATLEHTAGASFSVHESAIMQGRAVVRQGLHASIPAERVGREVMKALRGVKPMRFFDIVAQMNALAPWFQELSPQKMTHLHHAHDACALTQWLCVCGAFSSTRNTDAAHTLATRLCLPKKFVDGGYLMALYHTAALHYSSLSVEAQRDMLMQVDRLYLNDIFWNPSLHPASEEALEALSRIKSVQLPQAWRNKGKYSGQYLRALQCEILRNSLSGC